MRDPFTSTSPQYREAMTLPHKTGSAFQIMRRPSGFLTKLFWGAVNALVGGVCIIAIRTLLIGLSK